MKPAFYNDEEYRKRQAEKTKELWRTGVYDSKIKWDERLCNNPSCEKGFRVKPHDKHKYCSSRCAALVNSPLREVTLSTRLKISNALKGKQNPYKGIRKVQYIKIICKNQSCRKELVVAPWVAKRQKYCSNICNIRLVGAQTTSPKASKGKPGIRVDIDSNICFYSTWEANIARIFNLLKIKWEYAPRVFELEGHTYRPDFYLPEYDAYIEVKNFMNEYSLNRDSLFRKLYPDKELYIISKNEYLDMKKSFKIFIQHWE